ncbi:MOSC domain-containing protein [Lentisalinibacter sediminis]|uniref:MOSC domain-containing protein n=1 Tax=Lentisalinibacter sediminis TaxID=2992237 RepID=UPI00386331E9
MTEGRLIGIARRERKHAPMEVLERALVDTAGGVAGDFRGRPGPRQVTVLTAPGWNDACREFGRELPWTARRANLLVDGIPLAETAGRRLVIGSLVLEITGELDPCSRMEEAGQGLRQALEPDWRGGVTCRVLAAGEIGVGDTVCLEDAHG